MALLAIANLHLSLGDRPLLEGVSLTLEPGDHVGLVGRNGCGKSTLLKLVAGLTPLKHDTGSIQVARGASVGYLTQDPELDPDKTLREEAGTAMSRIDQIQDELEQLAHDMGEVEGEALEKLLKRYEQLEHELEAAGGYAVDHKVDAILHGVGLTDNLFDVKVKDLSGGQKGRLALAKLLLSAPDILLLDEPTNHLDIAGRQWLEQYLAQCNSAVLLISHDRWLLDRVVTRIYELERGTLVEYPGNYGKFCELRAERIKAQQRAYEKQTTKIKQEKAFIDRYRAGQRAKQAQGREKRLERYVASERLEKPIELDVMNLRLTPNKRSSDVVIAVEHLTKGYDNKPLFSDLTFSIKRGDRLGVIGPNGAGKSTLIRCMLGEQDADRGSVRIGGQTDIAHFSQTHEGLNLSLTVVEHLKKFVSNELEQSARDLAGAFLFTGDEQDKKLSVMSGGERARTVLAGLVAGGHNVLVLDEPTNHLDIPSAERLEDSLKVFTAEEKGYGQSRNGGGTLILITHDRMLLDHLCNHLLILDGEGGCQHFLGTYHDYLAEQQKAAAEQQARQEQAEQDKAKQQAKQNARQQSNKQTNKTSPAKTNHGQSRKAPTSKAGAGGGAETKLNQGKLESKIETLTERIAAIDTELADPELYTKRFEDFSKLQDERAKLASELEPLETEWLRRAEG